MIRIKVQVTDAMIAKRKSSCLGNDNLVLCSKKHQKKREFVSSLFFPSFFIYTNILSFFSLDKSHINIFSFSTCNLTQKTSHDYVNV